MAATEVRLISSLADAVEVEQGEPVGIIGENEADYLAAYLGVLRAGGTAVPLNAMLDPDSIRSQLDLVRARFVLSAARVRENRFLGSPSTS